MPKMQLRSSTTYFTNDEMVRVQFIEKDSYSVMFKVKNKTCENTIEYVLTSQQLTKLHMMIGLMIPEPEILNENRILP